MVPDQIVLATDFSPASLAARSVAARMAKLFKCGIVLVHVFEYVARHEYMMPVGWMIQTIRTDVQRQMLETQQALTETGIQTETLLLEDGLPIAEILNAAKAHMSPIIVMGTHAVAGMERFLLGSNAEGVLREATCPVITVGPHVQLLDAANAPVRLLFATDFSKESFNAAPFITTIRDAAASTLQILHVQTYDHDAKKSETLLVDSLRLAFDAEDPDHHHPPAECLTLHGVAVAQAIVNEAERIPADLLILGVRRASEFTTHLAAKVAFQVIAAAPCAVLTISS
jgi:nucleotide-binding universal stress UspA family protein